MGRAFQGSVPLFGLYRTNHFTSIPMEELTPTNRPIRLTQCCTQFKSPGIKILCVLYLHYNVVFSFKCLEIPETKSFIPKGFELGTTLC